MTFLPLGGLIAYLEVIVSSFLVNIAPAFTPPTWIVLSLFKIHNPGTSIIVIAMFGVIGSVLGRYVMYAYSKFFSKYISKKEERNLSYFRKFVGGKEFNLYLGTFLYALTPLPSNFLFISLGLSKTKIGPAMIGFALGRFLSYFILITTSFRTFNYFSLFVDESKIRLAMDLFGIISAIAILFVNWESVYNKSRIWGRKLKFT